MKAVVFMVGLPGVGKRTMSKHLERELGFRRFNSDETRRELGIREYDPRDTPRVLNLIYERMEAELAAGRGVILHSVYATEGGRQRVYNLAKNSRAQIVVVECHAPDAVAIGRLTSRMKKDELHMPTTDPEVHSKYVSRWQQPRRDFGFFKNRNVSHILLDTATGEISKVRVRRAARTLVENVVAQLRTFRPPDVRAVG